MNGSGGGAGSASGNSWGTGSTGTSSHPDQTAAAAAPFGNAAGGGTRSQLVVTLWEELRANPTEWFDNRADKANGRSKPNSPDFRNKNDRTKAVWIIDRAAPFWASEWLQQHPPGSLVAASTAGASQFSSASSSSDDAALWEDLRQNPDKWWDNRARKTNPKAPDFVRKDDRAVALWINGRKPVPNWVPKFLMFLDEAKKINE
ncbi:hypothetical protein HXX76_012055 [Chlamydomonas incerta]|uniref:Uncharacterized protein n=1 Tax=Chlamydomonas incerta TaxID=51695 RepID=A0A835SWB8_CHLIN|nr:hypothetical protein HXX76_012055 [Chlamydomonas incerta]|eukprot:KAG2427730.1 hypothetical protein HXX76_012055 [Chlamydomonas incerta]